MPEPVIQAAMPCTVVMHARNLETGEEAVILTTRLKRPHNWRWSWVEPDKAAYDREYHRTVRKPHRNAAQDHV